MVVFSVAGSFRSAAEKIHNRLRTFGKYGSGAFVLMRTVVSSTTSRLAQLAKNVRDGVSAAD